MKQGVRPNRTRCAGCFVKVDSEEGRISGRSHLPSSGPSPSLFNGKERGTPRDAEAVAPHVSYLSIDNGEGACLYSCTVVGASFFRLSGP